MCTIADKYHSSMDEIVEACAAKLVDAEPIESERCIANHGFYSGYDFFFGCLCGRIGVGAKLQVDAIDIVRLLV